MHALILTLLALGGGEYKTGHVPEILVRAHMQRMAFKTAYFKYSVKTDWPNEFAPSKVNYEARIVGDDIYWTNHGDDDGILFKDGISGRAIFGVMHACSPQHTMRIRASNEEWFHRDGEAALYVTEPSRSPNLLTDPRCYGLNYDNKEDIPPSQKLERLLKRPAKWTDRVVDGIHEVKMLGQPYGEEKEFQTETIYRIDPAKDDSIIEIRSAQLKKDERFELAEVTIEHALSDGHWWPKKYDSYAPRTQWREVVVFEKVEFDRASHPQRMTPDLYGIANGVLTADFRSIEPITHIVKTGNYMGNGVFIPEADWEAVATEYDRQALRDYTKEMAQYGSGEVPKWWCADQETLGLKGVASDPDLWESYVRRWIVQHTASLSPKTGPAPDALDEQQVNAAWAILKDCRKRANPIEVRMKEKAADSPESAGQEKTGEKAAGDSPYAVTPTQPNGETRAIVAKTGRHDSGSDSREERELAAIFKTLQRRLDNILREKQLEIDDSRCGKVRRKYVSLSVEWKQGTVTCV